VVGAVVGTGAVVLVEALGVGAGSVVVAGGGGGGGGGGALASSPPAWKEAEAVQATTAGVPIATARQTAKIRELCMIFPLRAAAGGTPASHNPGIGS
jgi:hypothetical protein